MLNDDHKIFLVYPCWQSEARPRPPMLAGWAERVRLQRNSPVTARLRYQMLAFLKSRIQRKINEIRKRGLWVALRKSWRDHIYSHRRHVFVERDLSKPHMYYSRRRKYEIRILDPEQDLAEFEEHYSSAMPKIQELFDKGLIGLAAFVDGVLVGYMWYATDNVHESKYNHIFCLKEGEVYQTAGYLIPKYRGTLMVLDTMNLGEEYFRDKGFKTTMCVVDTENEILLKLHFKLGFQERGAVLHTRKLFFYHWSRVENYEGLRYERYKDRRPRRRGGD